MLILLCVLNKYIFYYHLWVLGYFRNNYVYAWLKRLVFDLDWNWQSVSASWKVLGRLFQSLGAK